MDGQGGVVGLVKGGLRTKLLNLREVLEPELPVQLLPLLSSLQEIHALFSQLDHLGVVDDALGELLGGPGADTALVRATPTEIRHLDQLAIEASLAGHAVSTGIHCIAAVQLLQFGFLLLTCWVSHVDGDGYHQPQAINDTQDNGNSVWCWENGQALRK